MKKVLKKKVLKKKVPMKKAPMKKAPMKNLPMTFLWVLMGFFPTAFVASEALPSVTELMVHRDQFMQQEANGTDLKFKAESIAVADGHKVRMAVDIKNVDYQQMMSILSQPKIWCELMFLHLNVKACVYRDTVEEQTVKIYVGRKFYQPPKKAKQIEFNFKSGQSDDGLDWITLSAAKGPYGTSDYYIGFYFLETETGSFVDIVSSQKTGDLVDIAMDFYFATWARKKVGFSVIGEDSSGNSKFVRGQQGVLERNIVRYLLALNVVLKTQDLEGLGGWLQRADMWYESTDKYKTQLYEVKKQEYLKAKKREYSNQVSLQSIADNN